MNITAIVLAHNEEKKIRQAIASVSFCVEVIVVDDESSDRTGEIAREAKAKVLSHPLQNNFAEQRNWAMSQAKSDWILFIDADEIVSEELKEELSTHAFSFESYSIPRRDYFWNTEMRNGETKKVYEQGIIRLMKKGSGTWKGEVHEVYVPNKMPGKLNGFINHFAHDSLSSFIKDINLYTTLRSTELYKQGKRTSLFELVFFPLGKFLYTYFLLGGIWDGAAGFAYSFVMSFHSFLVRAKLITKSYV